MRIEEEIQQTVFRDVFQRAHVNLIFTAGWLQSQLAQRFKPFGLTLPQFNILRILRGQHPHPASVQLLIQRMLDKTSNASRIVDKLEAKALVTRTVCPHDRRAVDVLITAKGLALLEQIDAADSLSRIGFQHLTAEEATQLNTLLDRVRG
ncbi:MAG: MarR family transcriptional regulator [Hymenobacteraceae bacterium]|nr:MarR family transcriptional regulator [Hymenobacteraceae bacterium]